MTDYESMLRLAILLLWRQDGKAQFTQEFLEEFDFINTRVSISTNPVNGILTAKLEGWPVHPADTAPKTAQAERLDRPRSIGPSREV